MCMLMVSVGLSGDEMELELYVLSGRARLLLRDCRTQLLCEHHCSVHLLRAGRGRVLRLEDGDAVTVRHGQTIHLESSDGPPIVRGELDKDGSEHGLLLVVTR